MNYSHLRGKSIGGINIKMICNLQLFKRDRIIKYRRKLRTPENKWLNWFKGCFHITQILRKTRIEQKVLLMSFISKMVKLHILLSCLLLLLNQIFSGARIILIKIQKKIEVILTLGQLRYNLTYKSSFWFPKWQGVNIPQVRTMSKIVQENQGIACEW